MLTKATRIRLVIFVAVSVVVLAVTSLYYVQLPELLGFGQYTVTADFADSSGLYSNALVTYRGAQVGKVGAITLHADGTTVELNIDDNILIPADSTATIHSTSAIGEQYVDLVPRAGHGVGLRSDLHDGSTIPRRDTVGLQSTSALLDRLDALIQSIQHGPLGRALTDIAQSFGDSGPDLQRLIDSTTLLLNSAQANFGPTRDLLHDFEPFLRTQQQLAGNTTTTVDNLASFTKQLVLSNRDIVHLLHSVPAAARQLVGVEHDLTPSLNVLLANLTSTFQVMNVYVPALKQVLTVYPALVADLISFAQPTASTGYIPLYFHLNIDDPPECIKGFLPPTKRRDPSQTKPINTPTGLYCKVAKSAPQSVRGTRNLPCLNNPGVRAATPAACLGKPEPGPGSALPAVDRQKAQAYQPKTGKLFMPDGTLLVVGDVASNSGKERKWQDLLLRPIGK
jgi:phospholipid/cholesterol/gamma-HCH transport system substrate-binding protein